MSWSRSERVIALRAGETCTLSAGERFVFVALGEVTAGGRLMKAPSLVEMRGGEAIEAKNDARIAALRDAFLVAGEEP